MGAVERSYYVRKYNLLMAQRFTRASLLTGFVAPTGASVRVPTGADPELAVAQQTYGDMSKRIGAFQDLAAKMGHQQAEASGLLYGARNAPTQEDMAEAAEAGKPVELVGDPNSLQTWQQAAYKGSLAVTSARYEVAGRRKLSEAMAAAAEDPSMTPIDFRKEMDSITRNYSAALSSVSSVEGAKMQKSLSLVANSNLQTFSRNYMSRMTRQNKADAISRANTITNDAMQIVNGYAIPIVPQDNAASLNDTIIAQRQKIQNDLTLNSVPSAQINTKLNAFDTAMQSAKIARLMEFGRSQGGLTRLSRLVENNGKGLTGAEKEIWNSLSATDKSEFYKEANTQLTQRMKVIDTELKTEDNRRKINVENAIIAYSEAVANNDASAARQAIGVLTALGHNTRTMTEAASVDPTILRSDPSQMEQAQNLLNARRLSPQRIYQFDKLTSRDRRKLMKDLVGQRDKLMQRAQDHLNRIYQPDFTTSSVQLGREKLLANQQYNLAIEHLEQKRDEHDEALAAATESGTLATVKRFDPAEHMPEATKKVDAEINAIKLPEEIGKVVSDLERSLELLTNHQARREKQGKTTYDMSVFEGITDDNLEDKNNVKALKKHLLGLRERTNKTLHPPIDRLLKRLIQVEQLQRGGTR
jgi:hypothetical protein